VAQKTKNKQKTKGKGQRAEMALHDQDGDQEQPSAIAAELQSLSDLIQRYPAEAQLIMSAIEDGLTLGPMQAIEAD
jgi:hypothetical protein